MLLYSIGFQIRMFEHILCTFNFMTFHSILSFFFRVEMCLIPICMCYQYNICLKSSRLDGAAYDWLKECSPCKRLLVSVTKLNDNPLTNTLAYSTHPHKLQIRTIFTLIRTLAHSYYDMFLSSILYHFVRVLISLNDNFYVYLVFLCYYSSILFFFCW